MLISREFAVHLEDRFKKQITSISPLTSSQGNQTVKLGLEDGKFFFLKWNTGVHPGYYAAEARGLQEIEIKGKLTVPQVIAYGEATSDYPSYVVLEFLNKSQPTIRAWKELGRCFGRMHKVEEPLYGFEKDNYIGGSVQSNKQHSSWPEFFVEERLRYQLKLGRETGWVDDEIEDAFENKFPTMIELLSSDVSVKPVLLHGDLWLGNIFWSDKGPYVIDPAVYYGSREADLAFSELFSGFPRFFYDGYKEENPLDEGYPGRRSVLNLYHVMNHSCLFGGHYVDSVKQILESI